jgi:uncharacterized membrane protein
MAITAYLLWTSLSNGQVAGCGDDTGGCLSVLASRWSRWLRVPVALPGLIVQTLTFAGLLAVGTGGPRRRRFVVGFLLMSAATLAGSACWFVALQVFVLGSFCGYCLAAHTCGVLVAGLILALVFGGKATLPPGIAAIWLLLGTSGPGLLIAGQVLVTPDWPGTDVNVVPESPGIPAVENPETYPRLTLGSDGNIVVKVEEHPLLGDAHAKRILVDLYDYTCPHCRILYSHLKKARLRYGDQLTILLVPVPLNPDCNPYFRSRKPEHKDSCHYVRLALAVWNLDRIAFETFHTWLFETEPIPSPEQARSEAERLVGAARLAKALSNDGLDRQIERNTLLFHLSGGKTLPKMMYQGMTAVGLPPSLEHLFGVLEKRLDLTPQETR